MLMLLDSAANYYELRINTSNREYYNTLDPDFGNDANYFTLTNSVVADMDAGDTAIVQINQNGGAAQTDINIISTFSGILVA